ncbi:hypothetical protein HYALB_00012993 [Hymenoscyphus albidus]|uniref:Heterokaryon incompatibility domain-containing protein n=1 Tax=Hymenoscyphus albidus TaxID=595503 RepID=A0A9N9LX37_9HELO|nr:hypothetical protein HYALB_00012993 [Hymenoscyphus albidus]
MNSSSTTPYQPLVSSSEIRLLLLMPGSTDSPIQCSLVHTKIGENPYEALSYEWGTSQSNEPSIYIFDASCQALRMEYKGLSRFWLNKVRIHPSNPTGQISGAPRQVRHNLYHALSRIRLEHKERCLWVDALCIDQANHGERTHQVEMMGKIYQSAERVIAWLGEGNENDVLAMDTFRKIIASSGWGRQDHPVISIGRNGNVKNGVDVLRVQAIVDWGSKSYWHRLWIVQELVLAKDLLVIVGRESITGKELDSTMVALEPFAVLIAGDSATKLMGRTLTERWKNILAFPLLLARQKSSIKTSMSLDGPGGRGLCDWMLRCSDSECMDPRDRVYGLLGVSEDITNLEEAQVAIEVDYEKTLLEVYCDVARFWAARNGRSMTNSALGIGLRKHFNLRSSDIRSAKDEIEKAFYMGRRVWATKKFPDLVNFPNRLERTIRDTGYVS